MSFSKEKALIQVKNLVAQFKQNESDYKNNDLYDETATRNEFIDKFFIALGWDINNDRSLPLESREVEREANIKVAGKVKKADYLFKFFGRSLFYVEAKKPSVNIKDDVAPAYQIRRYAWNKRLSVSILTDFEEFAVYDTTVKPREQDGAAVSRIKFIHYSDYEKEFDWIWERFSREAVLNYNFDKFLQTEAKESAKSSIDAELLKTIEGWRLDLAKNVALRNPELSVRNLNLAVQRIIDRIVFLRIAEDRQIEDEESLKNAAKSGNVWKSLNILFSAADEKYNSGLFDIKSDSFIAELKIDEVALKSIIESLYYPKCPYEWSVLPIEILGSIYEQFLGSAIRFKGVSGGRHTAIVEKKTKLKRLAAFITPRNTL